MTLARSFATRKLAWPAYPLDVHSHQDAAWLWAGRWLRHEDIAVDAHHDLRRPRLIRKAPLRITEK